MQRGSKNPGGRYATMLQKLPHLREALIVGLGGVEGIQVYGAEGLSSFLGVCTFVIAGSASFRGIVSKSSLSLPVSWAPNTEA